MREEGTGRERRERRRRRRRCSQLGLKPPRTHPTRKEEREREMLPATTPASKDTPNKKRNKTMVFPRKGKEGRGEREREGKRMKAPDRFQ